MRYLLVFMFAVGIFVLGRQNSCHLNLFGGTRGEGPLRSETRNTEPFHGIELQLAGDVEVVRGETSEVVVEAQENLLPLLKTDIENGVLKIHFSENVSYSKDLKIRVTTPSLDEIDLMSSGTIKLVSQWEGDQLSLGISGSGDIEAMQLNGGNLECNIGGSGSIKLAGKMQSLDAGISGSGDLFAGDLVTQTAKLKVSGSGGMRVHVEQTLDANISGSGEIEYSGDARASTKVSGSGEVKQVGGKPMM
ncbi:MAG: DUF2807 domain-containing protein [Saprospiraceae bacterium]|nr:DUF2807 domain-containing protein [Saprospiraceae bacterium]